ncbi:MAG TPA: undecaprenyl-diphosphatase [Parvularcula sp.]|nr:undecaprenyl-diphosphatase [Parvularcula sp.]
MQENSIDTAEAAAEGFIVAALLLGVVEGLTEFIPVSSTGHLIVLVDFFNVKTPPGRVFEICIQLGAILAVCVVYRRRLLGKALGLFSDPAAQRFAIGILAAFAPAVALGLVAGDVVREQLFRPEIVAAMLILGGIAIIVLERRNMPAKFADADTVDPMTALKIGLIQCLAFVPGVSRSGATIIGARMLGLSPTAAAEFSFFVAIPTMLGATAYSAYKARNDITADGMAMVAVGFFAAFICALVVVKAVIGFIARRGLMPFAYYRIGLGVLIFALLAAGFGRG